ncbi:ribonuclease P/MRP protein subunit RPP1 [Methanomicrobium sp. W14]|uniref:RNase P subunit p30 family protein n=1 Tax=Methanomicrobium sp. W14 TaxID=2817839 RepID=UPI001AE5A0DA|nr:RNase P subunit p30 family protein [Methanomicrobium sp. W14]MBP2132456.1 ribonuclease P/MRP protein subunit RPP1 [Methanomicrobium sp. W14]
MVLSDACVFVYPDGDTSVRRMALESRYLGIERILCAGYSGCNSYSGVFVVGAVCLRPKDFRNFMSSLKKTGSYDIITVAAGDAGLNRSLISSGRIHILRGIEYAPKKAFDDVCALNAAEKGTAIDINLSSLTRKKGILRQKALDSFSEILKFQRKFGFSLTLSSGARSCTELLSVRDMENLCGLFGMTDDEVKSALNSVDSLLSPCGPVEVI